MAASNNTPPGGGKIHIGTAVVTHGSPGSHPAGTLPFTGADIGVYGLAGIILVVIGLWLRARATANV